jgi:hypothetical protein
MGKTTLLVRGGAFATISVALLIGAGPVYAFGKSAAERKEPVEADAAAKPPVHDGGSAHAEAADGGPSKRDLAKARKEAREAEKKWLVSNNYSIPHAQLKAESSRHARRIARLRRIRAVAEAAKDEAAVQRVDGLLSKEKDRHEQWAKHHAQKAASDAAAPAKHAGSAAPAASGAKAGAQ